MANVLTRQGEAWLVRFGAQSVFARDSLGFGYLVQLLQRPWQPLHALELFASVHRRTTHTQAGVPDDKGGRRKALVDSILEQGAVSEFRKRLVDLENEIEAAERNHDLARLEAATREREWLLQEIRRSRKVVRCSPEAERARRAVSKCIERAIEKLLSISPALGYHLQASIHCGLYCCYRPPPQAAVAWEVIQPRHGGSSPPSQLAPKLRQIRPR